MCGSEEAQRKFFRSALARPRATMVAFRGARTHQEEEASSSRLPGGDQCERLRQMSAVREG